jgi:hypothetical protein
MTKAWLPFRHTAHPLFGLHEANSWIARFPPRKISKEAINCRQEWRKIRSLESAFYSVFPHYSKNTI